MTQFGHRSPGSRCLRRAVVRPPDAALQARALVDGLLMRVAPLSESGTSSYWLSTRETVSVYQSAKRI